LEAPIFKRKIFKKFVEKGEWDRSVFGERSGNIRKRENTRDFVLKVTWQGRGEGGGEGVREAEGVFIIGGPRRKGEERGGGRLT